MEGLGSPEPRSQSSGSLMRSPLQRKEALRSALNKAKSLHNVDENTVQDLGDIVREVDEICHELSIDEKVNGHDEVLMDSEVMVASAKVLKNSANTLTKEISPYDARDYAAKLLQLVHTMPDETLVVADWSILEADICKVFKRTPTYSTLCGCLHPPERKVEKPPIVRMRRPREALAPIKRPEAVVKVNKNEIVPEEVVPKIKRLISQHYKDVGTPLELYRLVIDPREFSKTIENMLHISFLVRDGYMHIKLDGNKTPIIEPSSKEMRSQFKKATDKVNIQNILSLSPQQWQTIIDTLNITAPMINF